MKRHTQIEDAIRSAADTLGWGSDELVVDTAAEALMLADAVAETDDNRETARAEVWRVFRDRYLTGMVG